MTYVFRPFALFILVDTSHETINYILNEGYRSVGAVWDYFLVTSSYDHKPGEDHEHAGKGTRAPIPDDFKPDFVGKSLQDVATWFKQMPDDMGLDPHFFAIIDKGAEEDGTLVICRMGGKEFEGSEIYTGRFPAREATVHMGGMEHGTWEELFGDRKEATKIRY